MFNRVYKNHQINVGVPFRIKPPVILQTVKCTETQPVDGSAVREVSPKENAEKHLQTAREQADVIIREAELEAQRIIQQAHIDSEKKRNAVLEDARQKGYAKGYDEGKKQYEHLIKEAQLIKENSLHEYREILEGAEADIIEMVLDIAKKVVAKEVQTDRSIILDLVREAFGRCINREKVVLKVSSEDYDYVVENKKEILSSIEGVDDIDIKEDSSMKAGSCIVETPFGSFDAGVNTKISRIEEAFMQAVGR